jgi:hypothetical protein
MCFIAPGPFILAISKVSPGCNMIEGDTFQPCPPRSDAAFDPVPCTAIPPLPFSPVKFSAQIDLDCASDSLLKLERSDPNPLYISVYLLYHF